MEIADKEMVDVFRINRYVLACFENASTLRAQIYKQLFFCRFSINTERLCQCWYTR